jgi:hypothetical protein
VPVIVVFGNAADAVASSAVVEANDDLSIETSTGHLRVLVAPVTAYRGQQSPVTTARSSSGIDPEYPGSARVVHAQR